MRNGAISLTAYWPDAAIETSQYRVFSPWRMSPWVVSERRSVLTAGCEMERHSCSNLSCWSFRLRVVSSKLDSAAPVY